jgi:DNA-binding protein H-NS
MPSLSLESMDVDALIELRAEIDTRLHEQARDLQRQLALLDGGGRKGPDRPPVGAQRASSLRGVKVAPKYRGPDGETWAGRGAKPRWLAALLKEGHSIEQFLIGAGRKGKAATEKRAIKKGRKRPVKARRRTKNIQDSQPGAAD